MVTAEVNERYQLCGVFTDLFNRPRVAVVENLQTRHARFSSTHHTHFTTLLNFVWDYPGELVSERKNQEGKTNLDLLEQEIVSGSGICWAIRKSATHPRHITTQASHHSDFYRPDALPAAQPTASKH